MLPDSLSLRAHCKWCPERSGLQWGSLTAAAQVKRQHRLSWYVKHISQLHKNQFYLLMWTNRSTRQKSWLVSCDMRWICRTSLNKSSRTNQFFLWVAQFSCYWQKSSPDLVISVSCFLCLFSHVWANTGKELCSLPPNEVHKEFHIHKIC